MNTPRWAFKGSRDYLHSTTVFDRLMSEVGGDPRKVDFRFNRRTDRQCEITALRPSDEARVVAAYTDVGHRLYVISTNMPITERVPYDEDGLAKNFEIEGNVVRLAAVVPGFSFIECTVAAYKRLLLSMQERPRRFAFVRISLAHLPRGGYAVEFDRKLSSDFYQGTLSEDGAPIGRIFFGEWR